MESSPHVTSSLHVVYVVLGVVIIQKNISLTELLEIRVASIQRGTAVIWMVVMAQTYLTRDQQKQLPEI